MSGPSSLTLERAADARVTAVHARDAGSEAMTAAAGDDRDRWEALLQDSLMRAGHEAMTAAAIALNYAAYAARGVAAARAAEPEAQDTNVVEDADDSETYDADAVANA